MFIFISTVRRFHVVSIVFAVFCFAALSLCWQSPAVGQNAGEEEKATVPADNPGGKKKAVTDNASEEKAINSNINKGNSDEQKNGNQDLKKNSSTDKEVSSNDKLYTVAIMLVKAIVLAGLELLLLIICGILKPYFYHHVLSLVWAESLQSLARSCIELDKNDDKKKNTSILESFTTFCKHPISTIIKFFNRPESDSDFLNKIIEGSYTKEKIDEVWKRVKRIYHLRYWGAWFRWFEKTSGFAIILFILYHISKYIHFNEMIVKWLFG